MKIDKNSASFIGLGFELLILSLGGIFFGQYIDSFYGSKDIATFILVFILLIAWTYRFILVLKKYEKEIKEKSKNKKKL